MKRIWLGGVAYWHADDISRLIVASAIEIDAVTYFVSDFSCCAVCVHTTHLYRVDGEYDDDADAGVRYVVPPRYPRCCSGHRGACGRMRCSDDLHLYIAPKICLHGLALLHVSPHPHRQSAVASSDGEIRCSGHHISLWASITVHRCHVDLEDVPLNLRLPWPVEQHCDCSFL